LAIDENGAVKLWDLSEMDLLGLMIHLEECFGKLQMLIEDQSQVFTVMQTIF